MRRLLPLVVVTALPLAAIGSATLWPAAVAVDAPKPVPPAEERAVVADAATATLAVALIAAGHHVESSPRADAFGLEIARIARGYLLRRAPGFRDDCSGFASAVFSTAGVAMDHDVWSLWEKASENDALHWGDPVVGDLVFFDDTADRNGDGRWNDDLTHVGVVVDVEPDDTVVFAHAGMSSGRSLGVLNLEDPASDRAADGHRINTWLREPRPGDPPTATYLAGELWAGFAHVDPALDWL